jgi:hypothetical protein
VYKTLTSEVNHKGDLHFKLYLFPKTPSSIALISGADSQFPGCCAVSRIKKTNEGRRAWNGSDNKPDCLLNTLLAHTKQTLFELTHHVPEAGDSCARG